jgi:hypothetical protein
MGATRREPHQVTWNFLPAPVRATGNELAVFESSRTPVAWSVVIWPTIAWVSGARANDHWPVSVRIWSVREIGRRRNISVRMNVNRARVDRPQRNDHASVGLRGVDTDQHYY